MASHIYPIPEVHRSVTRPITMDIIREVLDITGFRSEDFRTKMVGFSEAESVPGSSLKQGEVERPNRLNTDEKLTMEITEEDVGDNITPIRYPDTTPVFHDPALKITLKPVMSLAKATVSVVINVPSRVRATNWLYEVKRRIYQNQMTNYHTVDYHYPIPKPYTHYLIQMHAMREQVEGLNESFGEWMKRCFVNRWTVISNLEGHEKLLAIQERQTNIYGWFNFDFEPQKAEKNSDNPSGWEIRFEYTFHYQRPDMMVFAYPLMIHNQLLPIEMIDTSTKDNIDSYNTYQGFTGAAYDVVAKQSNPYAHNEFTGLKEPVFDDWLIASDPPYYAQLIRALIAVDPNDKRWAIGFDDLSDNFSFKDYMLRYMAQMGNKMLHLNHSIFFVRLYRWDSMLNYPDIEIGNDLRLTTTFDMDLKDMWHVVIYVNINPLILLPGAWDDLIDHPEVMEDWLEAIGATKPDESTLDPDGGTKPGDSILDPDGNVDEDALQELLDELKDQTGTGGEPGNHHGIPSGLPKTNEKFTAGFTIIARKGE